MKLKQKGQILLMDMDQLPPRPQIRCLFTLLSLCWDQVERFKLDDLHFAFYLSPVYLSQKSTEEEQLLRVGSRRKERNSG